LGPARIDEKSPERAITGHYAYGTSGIAQRVWKERRKEANYLLHSNKRKILSLAVMEWKMMLPRSGGKGVWLYRKTGCRDNGVYWGTEEYNFTAFEKKRGQL